MILLLVVTILIGIISYFIFAKKKEQSRRVLLVGLRGSGKSVAMNYLQNEPNANTVSSLENVHFEYNGADVECVVPKKQGDFYEKLGIQDLGTRYILFVDEKIEIPNNTGDFDITFVCNKKEVPKNLSPSLIAKTIHVYNNLEYFKRLLSVK